MAHLGRIYLVFLSVTVLVKLSTQSKPEASVRCTETGFSPAVKQLYKGKTSVKFAIKLGSGGPGCEQSKNVVAAGDGSEQIGVADLNGNKEIPFKKDDAVACGGELANGADGSTIDYTVNLEVVLTETIRKVIKRQLKYEFALRCHMTRDVKVVTGGKWKISSKLDAIEKDIDASNTFSLATSLKFYDQAYNTEKSAQFELAAGDNLYVRVAEDTSNPLFKFAVNKCWSTPDANPDFKVQDVFFDKRCPVDDTMGFTEPKKDDFTYDFWIKAFFFSVDQEKEKAVYIHCGLFVCKTDDTDPKCAQPNKATCDASTKTLRKRRSIGIEHRIEERIISSRQQIVFDTSDIYAPTCKDGYVYDRKNKGCTHKQLLEIKGVYLDIEWNPMYANTSSHAFKDLAREKSYQLYALLQTAGRGSIHGVKVVRARQGGVILDVQVNYCKDSSAQSAFTEVEDALRKTRSTSTRVINILNINQDKAIRYVPITTKTENRMDKMTLLIIVGVLLALVLLAAITVFKVRQTRQRSAGQKGFDNTSLMKTM